MECNFVEGIMKKDKIQNTNLSSSVSGEKKFNSCLGAKKVSIFKAQVSHEKALSLINSTI